MSHHQCCVFRLVQGGHARLAASLRQSQRLDYRPKEQTGDKNAKDTICDCVCMRRKVCVWVGGGNTFYTSAITRTPDAVHAHTTRTQRTHTTRLHPQAQQK